MKVFHSFVNPRAKVLDFSIQELLEPAAKRTAQQIAFLIRQRNAEMAEYLRNSDREADARSLASLSLNPLVLVCCYK